jgi:glycopeptide antibiotics resistance protein
MPKPDQKDACTMTFEINSAGLYLAITILWAAMRLIRGLATRQFDLKRELVVTLMFVFLCLLSYRLLEPFRFNLERNLKANFVPIVNSLLMIQRAEASRYQPLIRIVQFLLLGNLVVFMPIGMLISVLFKDLRSGWKMLLLGAGFSLVVETLQALLAVRVFDVDDILLNALGTWLGYLVFRLFCLLPPLRKWFDSVAAAQRKGALGFFVFASLSIGAVFLGFVYWGWHAAENAGEYVLGEPEGRTLLQWFRWLFSRGYD